MKFIKLGGYHGRTFGALALTHFKYIMKVDIPSLPWPIAPFPQYLYPLDQYEKENKEEGRGGEKIFRVVKIFRERCLGRILRLVIHYLENNSERKLRIVMINEQELPSDIFNNERC